MTPKDMFSSPVTRFAAITALGAGMVQGALAQQLQSPNNFRALPNGNTLMSVADHEMIQAVQGGRTSLRVMGSGTCLVDGSATMIAPQGGGFQRVATSDAGGRLDKDMKAYVAAPSPAALATVVQDGAKLRQETQDCAVAPGAAPGQQSAPDPRTLHSFGHTAIERADHLLKVHLDNSNIVVSYREMTFGNVKNETITVTGSRETGTLIFDGAKVTQSNHEFGSGTSQRSDRPDLVPTFKALETAMKTLYAAPDQTTVPQVVNDLGHKLMDAPAGAKPAQTPAPIVRLPGPGS